MRILKNKYFCLFFLVSTISYAGEIPGTIYQVSLGQSVMSIESAKKTSMRGLYSIDPRKAQLDEPLTRLLVKVDKSTKLIIQIVGEADLGKEECKVAATRLKEKYEKSFGVNFSILGHQGDKFNVVEQKKVFFMIGCENKRKTILRVTLAST